MSDTTRIGEHHEHDHSHSAHVHDHDHGGHGHGHDHDHGGHAHSHAPKSLKALIGVIILTTTIFLAEVIFGLLSGSLALLADAAHMLSDSAGLVIALVAILIGRRAANTSATFGYRRIEVIAAAVNALSVGAISIWIVIEAIKRLGGHGEIDTTMMLVVAVIGLIANGGSALLLVRRQHDSMNMRGAYLHVLSDMLGSVAVIIAGLIVRATGFILADTIASIVIAAIILPRSMRLLLDAMRVLMERVPGHVDLNEIRVALEEIPGVETVHDLHVWTMDGNELIATCHLVIEPDRVESGCNILDVANHRLEKIGVSHATIQIETADHAEHEAEVHD
ncbi:cation diffusion facilitator family transporter [Corynebacterium pygosceleis]|uniref:cation diffusion facilitator family transporter n=1 Tax=Corynebacterium pygosceleis TaxID=2800406 RepID=UPI001907E244|nr:cation diffusion facilitator family transporter [Corynebacterium pygosceleis]MCK7675576.1 cation diffusion facilitator family transporter [Corynebacterium pygosceleis]MCL0121030.1 cation diffusion facilitator family transporter [Corynebacterium pygosceleis]